MMNAIQFTTLTSRRTLNVTSKLRVRPKSTFSHSFVVSRFQSSNNHYEQEYVKRGTSLLQADSTSRFFSSEKGDIESQQTTEKIESNNDLPTSLADEEWKKFQDSLTFEPSMREESSSKKRKTRGGKVMRKRKEKALLLEQLKSSNYSEDNLGGGRFPTLRYSDEETEHLLKEAYANIPPRTGKRGTNNLRRQRNRWKAIYEQDAIKKQEKIAAHERRMEKRSRISREVREVKSSAEKVRSDEKNYQFEVLKKWVVMSGLSKESEVTSKAN